MFYTLKKGSIVNPADLKKAVEDAGFSVGELIVVFNFNNQKAEDNSSFTQDNITYTFMDTKPGVLAGLAVLISSYIFLESTIKCSL